MLISNYSQCFFMLFFYICWDSFFSLPCCYSLVLFVFFKVNDGISHTENSGTSHTENGGVSPTEKGHSV